MSEQAQERSYKDTLNLPRTAFPMKANLVLSEPASVKRWRQQNLYERIRQARAGAKRYAFHDGPPYANGLLHVGHLLNKILKDFVVRARTMAGYNVPFIPGWDCHGLPIESKVQMDLGADRVRAMPAPAIRKRCRDSAEKFIKLQKTQLERMLTLADYEHPYFTMDPAYEASVLEVFAQLVAHGLVYRALKPVHWSIDNRTALAEAELEYYDRQDTSIYVQFDVTPGSKLPASLNLPSGASAGLMIWTTTPWTLPANLAVAAGPTAEYALYRVTRGTGTFYTVLAAALAPRVFHAAGLTTFEELGRCSGRELAASGATYQHPFIDRISPIVLADYVTLDDGTGLVHTAPGHGAEDYATGIAHKLPIYCPVREDGTFDDTAPDWLRGKDVWAANGLVVDRLRASGHLVYSHEFTHSYPHDWRGKSPTIFRATEQWFISVDQPLQRQHKSLRQLALDATAKSASEGGSDFIPAWGRHRLRGMLESRPDWCISRQRAWGLPIPVFYPPEGVQGEPLLTKMSVLAVAETFRKHGSDAWFTLTPDQLLASYNAASDPDAPAWLKAQAWPCPGLVKGSDIFDVWLESGSSWYAVMVKHGLAHDTTQRPATDLYLEGSDQHRGWFQTSLLPAVVVTGRAPFAAVLTHGWTMDKDGRKMSKSLGNTLEVDDLLKDFGADVCRWWVSSANTEGDIKMDLSFFQLAGEQYRKVRNTIRFLLSNLYDFDPHHPYVFTAADAASIDAWALGELSRFIRDVRTGYDELNFRRVNERLYNFCNDTLSAVYLAAVKDRLYCDRADSPRRRRTQTVLHQIASVLIRLLAPILPHTADEAWAALHNAKLGDVDSVHLVEFPASADAAFPVDTWRDLMAQRDTWLKAIEDARQQRSIDNPLDLGLRVAANDALTRLALPAEDLADLCGISRFEIVSAGGPTSPEVLDLRDQPRCQRSWKRDGTVKPRSDGGLLSDRDAQALGL